MIGVDHPGSENTEEDNEGDELVDCPEDVASDVGDALLNVIIKLSNNSILSQGTTSDQSCFNRVILKRDFPNKCFLVKIFHHLKKVSDTR